MMTYPMQCPSKRWVRDEMPETDGIALSTKGAPYVFRMSGRK